MDDATAEVLTREMTENRQNRQKAQVLTSVVDEILKACDYAAPAWPVPESGKPLTIQAIVAWVNDLNQWSTKQAAAQGKPKTDSPPPADPPPDPPAEDAPLLARANGHGAAQEAVPVD